VYRSQRARMPMKVISAVPPDVQRNILIGLGLYRACRMRHTGGVRSEVLLRSLFLVRNGLTIEIARRMQSWFRRHDVRQEREMRKWNKRSPAFVAYMLNGGEAGERWIDDTMSKVRKSAVINVQARRN
jgi:hypothetical protein